MGTLLAGLSFDKLLTYIDKEPRHFAFADCRGFMLIEIMYYSLEILNPNLHISLNVPRAVSRS